MTTVVTLTNGKYPVQKSLRFRSSASAYLNRTPASASNRTTFTYSVWFKRGILNTDQDLFVAGSNVSGQQNFQFGFRSSTADVLQIVGQVSGSAADLQLFTSQVFRDPSAWYHAVVVIDTTQATAANRAKLYINGAQVTAFSSSTYPAQNYATAINNTVAHTIARFANVAANFFDGYLAEVNFVDGQALAPSSFGTYDTNGVWQPIKYSGTYGTNGFYLNFGNTTSTTALGYDTSGNGNNWTTNNISLTAGSTYDSMTDSPTVTSATVANYAVLNPILQNSWWAAPSRGTIQDGNLTAVSGASVEAFGNFNFVGNSGKWYYEVNCGATDTSNTILLAAQARATFEVAYYQGGNKQVNGGTPAAYGATWTSGDVIGVSIDVPNNNITFYKNNVSQGVINNAFPTSQPVYCGSYFNSSSGSHFYNFGQRPFIYTPPTGFNALNTYNLPTPTIANGAQYMAASTWTGNGTSQTINNGTNNTIGATFQPDFIWIKDRSTASSHALTNSIVGTSLYLISNTTNAELTDTTSVTAINSTGFVLGAGTATFYTNRNGDAFIGWQWKANGTGVTNTNGSITSTVSANTTAGFSVVTYTGTGANATVGHGLGVAPNMMFVKTRSTAGQDWLVYSSVLGGTQCLFLDLTNAATTVSTPWNNTSPTSSVFSIGTSAGSNGSGSTYVAYCWAAVSGYSAFGSYTGNGSLDGPFVYVGFRPRYVLIKRTDSTGDWYIWDTSRNTYNVVGEELLADTSGAGNTATDLDILSNGFKIRTTTAAINASGGTYIYAAFAESPFNTARAR